MADSPRPVLENFQCFAVTATLVHRQTVVSGLMVSDRRLMGTATIPYRRRERLDAHDVHHAR